MEEANENDGEQINGFSSVAYSVICSCCRVLLISMDEMLQSFEDEVHVNAKLHSKYFRNVIEFCSFKTLDIITRRPDLLRDKEIRRLMFEMMVAWESPDIESEALLKDSSFYKHPRMEGGGGSLFYTSATSVAVQVDYKNTVGLEAFAKIAPACAAVADSITALNIFDALTCTAGGRLHLLIYDKYLKFLRKALNSARCLRGSSSTSSLHLADEEIVLEFDGAMPANIVLRHIGMSTSVGRLTLTTRAIYFERFGASSKDKADRYDLSEDLKQVVKRDLTGPWGAHLFDNAVMYKASSLAEPIFFEFPQFIGHSRRDYWLAIIREVLYAHRFIRKHNLKHLQREEALSMAAFGVFRYRVIKDHFHVIPTQFRATLLFNLAEKLPKGDKILEALYKHLEDLTDGSGPSPFALYALDKMGFRVLPIEQWRPGDGDILLVDVRVGEASSLQKAVKKTICYSGRAEAAQATLEQVKVEDIDTNLTVIKELLFPLIELGKWLYSLTEWQDNLKSTLVLLLLLYTIYRGWIWQMWPGVLLSLSFLMLWNKYCRNGLQIEAFRITTQPNRSTVELIVTLQEAASQLESGVQTGCIVLLKLRAILFAAFPQTTNKVACTLAAMAMIFSIVPLRHLAIIFLLEFYTRRMPLRKESSEKLIRRLREWWVRIPAAPVQLIKPRKRSSEQLIKIKEN